MVGALLSIKDAFDNAEPARILKMKMPSSCFDSFQKKVIGLQMTKCAGSFTRLGNKNGFKYSKYMSEDVEDIKAVLDLFTSYADDGFIIDAVYCVDSRTLFVQISEDI